MAKQDLYKTAQQSAKLFKLIQDEQLLESWVKNKIISAAEDISTVYQYLNYEKQFKDYSQMIAESTDLSESKRALLTSKLAEAKEKVTALKKKAAKDKSEKMSEGFDEKSKEGDSFKTATGRAVKTDKGVRHTNTSYHDDGDAEEKSGKGIKSHAKAQSAAEKKEKAPAQKFSPKSAKTYGMKDGVKFDNRDKVDEAKAKCCCEEKGKAKCPVHGKVDEAKTMSRAAKGYEKFGPEGMKKLAQAGKDGASKKEIDAIRDKYNKYDEGKMPMKKVNGKMVPAFAADGKGKNDLEKKKVDEADVGKHNNGKTTGFKAVANKAAKEYGSKAAGERVAGAVKAKMAKAGKLEEAKPDFLDLDGDGNKKESMKKAAADKKKNPFGNKKVKEAIARAKDILEGKVKKKKDMIDMEGNAVTGGLADKSIPIGSKIPGTNVVKKKQIETEGKTTALKESAELDRMKVIMQRLNG